MFFHFHDRLQVQSVRIWYNRSCVCVGGITHGLLSFRSIATNDWNPSVIHSRRSGVCEWTRICGGFYDLVKSIVWWPSYSIMIFKEASQIPSVSCRSIPAVSPSGFSGFRSHLWWIAYRELHRGFFTFRSLTTQLKTDEWMKRESTRFYRWVVCSVESCRRCQIDFSKSRTRTFRRDPAACQSLKSN